MAFIISEENHLSTFKYTEKKRTLLTPAPEKGKLSILFLFVQYQHFHFVKVNFKAALLLVRSMETWHFLL